MPQRRTPLTPSQTDRLARRVIGIVAAVGALCAIGAIGAIGGCESQSFLDPSRTGSFSTTPTTMPILTRIDIIESDTDRFRDAQPPLPEDLIASDILYRMAPGDAVRVEIFELVRQGELAVTLRLIDQAGNLRLPNIGDVPAAGLTPQELQDLIENRLRDTLRDPLVNVSLEEGRSLQFSVMGASPGVSLYRLTRSDLRLLDAIALAGGAPLTTKRVYVIRRVAIDDAVSLPWEQRRPDARRPGDAPGRAPGGTPGGTPGTGTPAPVDIDALIRQLEDDDGAAPRDPSPSMMRRSTPPTVDIDELEPVRAPARPAATGADDFVFDRDRNEWVRASRAPASPDRRPGVRAGLGSGTDLLDDVAGVDPETAFFAERIISVDYQRLIAGDSRMNIVVRPNDVIYIEETEFGFVYIDGEISRAGVYTVPATGGLTLSRLVAAAGGLNPIAIPERVDLVRTVGDNREATVRVDLGAIRRRTEPDILLRPNDHIIIGTNFWAVPLAVIRNGFRATYGFGFLLDRNFGNDVFGAPPSNIGGGGG